MKKTIALLILFSTAISAQQMGSFTDPRDGKTYKTVKISEQIWMAENLNYAASGSRCYDDNPYNCKKYGRLYNWNTAIRACPFGWHLPHQSEFEVLSKAVGFFQGDKLKAKNGWNDYKGRSGNGTDEYGFSALPGGRGGYSDIGGFFGDIGDLGNWWSASNIGGYLDEAHSRFIKSEDLDLFVPFGIMKSFLLSVRCVRD